MKIISIQKENTSSLKVISLPHPRTFKQVKFGLDISNKEKIKLYEISKISNEMNSMFVGEIILKETKIYLIHQIDPLFLLIGIFKKRKSQFYNLNDLLFDENAVELEKVFGSLNRVELICDVKDVSGSDFYCLSDEKCLKFIRDKAEKLKSIFGEEKSEIELIVNYILDYLPPSFDEIFIKAKEEDIQQVNENVLEPDYFNVSRPTASTNSSSNVVKEDKKQSKSKESSAITRLKKVNTSGMKPLTSYFKKKENK